MDIDFHIHFSNQKQISYTMMAKILVLIFACGLLFFLQVRVSHIIIALLLLSALFYKIPSKYPFLLAIILLLLAPIAIFLHKVTLPRPLGLYAFYFLAIGIVCELRTYILPYTKNFPFDKVTKQVIGYIQGI